MTVVVLATVMALMGAVGFLRSLRPARRPMPDMRRQSRPSHPVPADAVVSGAVVGPRWAQDVARTLSTSPVARVVDPWLRMTSTSWAEIVARTLGGVAIGAGLGAVVAVGGVVLGAVGGAAVAAVVLLGAVAGATVPLATLRRRADEARQQAVRSVGSYLDLVVMCLAGGMGVESALDGAASVADDAFSARIAHEVRVAGTGGRPSWEALADLGDAIGVPELSELGATMRLAGTEGARVRDTLMAKADGLRRRQLARAETEANAVTERLFLPGVLLLVGFLVFIGYPALSRIVAGL